MTNAAWARSGGCRIFRLAVDGPGEYALTFELRRPWEHIPRERARVLIMQVAAGAR